MTLSETIQKRIDTKQKEIGRLEQQMRERRIQIKEDSNILQLLLKEPGEKPNVDQVLRQGSSAAKPQLKKARRPRYIPESSAEPTLAAKTPKVPEGKRLRSVKKEDNQSVGKIIEEENHHSNSWSDIGELVHGSGAVAGERLL